MPRPVITLHWLQRTRSWSRREIHSSTKKTSSSYDKTRATHSRQSHSTGAMRASGYEVVKATGREANREHQSTCSIAAWYSTMMLIQHKNQSRWSLLLLRNCPIACTATVAAQHEADGTSRQRPLAMALWRLVDPIPSSLLTEQGCP